MVPVATPPEFETVNISVVVLVVITAVPAGNVKVVGAITSCGAARPVPLRADDVELAEAGSVTVSVAVLSPTIEGVITTVIVQGLPITAICCPLQVSAVILNSVVEELVASLPVVAPPVFMTENVWDSLGLPCWTG